MIESQSLPAELIKFRRDFPDGIYMATFSNGETETSTKVLKRLNHMSGGFADIVVHGNVHGSSAVSLNLEVHKHGDDGCGVFDGFEWTTYQMDGHLTGSGADLHGFDPDGRELFLTLRR